MNDKLEEMEKAFESVADDYIRLVEEKERREKEEKERKEREKKDARK